MGTANTTENIISKTLEIKEKYKNVNDVWVRKPTTDFWHKK